MARYRGGSLRSWVSQTARQAKKPDQEQEMIVQGRQLIASMESCQLLHIKHRDRLTKQLAAEQSDLLR